MMEAYLNNHIFDLIGRQAARRPDAIAIADTGDPGRPRGDLAAGISIRSTRVG